MPTYAPFARPMYVMLKPVGSKCNLACDYCYYLEKEHLYSQKNLVMSDELLERFTQQYIESQTMPQVLFTWHGGETLMRPISFYKRALELQKRYARGRQIDNSIQTNGTLLNDEWCAFFKENNFLVGISIDGPQDFHDEYRRDKMGRPSFYRVMKGIELLQKHGVEYNCMAVVNDYNVDYPLEFYRFFKEIGCQFLQFTPIVERIRKTPPVSHQSTGKRLTGSTGNGYDGARYGRHDRMRHEGQDSVRHDEVNNIRHEGLRLATAKESEDEVELAPFTVPARKWGQFLCAIFDEWVKQDVGKLFIQLFDSTLANWVGEQPGVCTLARQCGHAGVMEFNGDVYSCDHFVFPEYYLGNIYTQTLTSMMYSPEQQKFGNDKHDALPQQCIECDMLFACHGECPKNRFIKDRYGNEGLNYLCEGYYRFFTHVTPYMDFMKQELLAKRPPANVMEWVKSKQAQ